MKKLILAATVVAFSGSVFATAAEVLHCFEDYTKKEIRAGDVYAAGYRDKVISKADYDAWQKRARAIRDAFEQHKKEAKISPDQCKKYVTAGANEYETIKMPSDWWNNVYLKKKH